MVKQLARRCVSLCWCRPWRRSSRSASLPVPPCEAGDFRPGRLAENLATRGVCERRTTGLRTSHRPTIWTSSSQHSRPRCASPWRAWGPRTSCWRSCSTSGASRRRASWGARWCSPSGRSRPRTWSTSSPASGPSGRTTAPGSRAPCTASRRCATGRGDVVGLTCRVGRAVLRHGGDRARRDRGRPERAPPGAPRGGQDHPAARGGAGARRRRSASGWWWSTPPTRSPATATSRTPASAARGACRCRRPTRSTR